MIDRRSGCGLSVTKSSFASHSVNLSSASFRHSGRPSEQASPKTVILK